MFENFFTGTRMTNAVNHGSMVETIGEDDTIWKFGTESGESGVIGDVARGKDECGLFTMEIGEFFLEREMYGSVSGDVTRATCACTIPVQSTAWKKKEGKLSGENSQPDMKCR